MFLVPSSAQWDWTFFLRPFKSVVWIVTFAIFAAIAIFIMLLKKFTKFNESIKWASFSAWFLFLFTNTYYGGAITMFMLTEGDLPFSSLEEALRLPEWKVITQGTIVPKSMSESGIPEFMKYWNDVQLNPNKYIFPSIEDAINHLLLEQKVILYYDKQVVSSLFKNNHDGLPPLKIIQEPRDSFLGLLFPKNSPLSSSFKIFGAKALDNGLQSRISKKWFGDGIPQAKFEGGRSLSIGHFVLCFIFFLFLTVSSIILLCFEMLLNIQI